MKDSGESSTVSSPFYQEDIDGLGPTRQSLDSPLSDALHPFSISRTAHQLGEPGLKIEVSHHARSPLLPKPGADPSARRPGTAWTRRDAPSPEQIAASGDNQ